MQEYLRADGKSPFATWFDGLDPQASAKIATAVLRIEAGQTSNLKGLGSGLAEYRIDWGPGYRVYLAQQGDELVILSGAARRSAREQTSRELVPC